MSETKPTGSAAFPSIGAIEPVWLDHDAMRNGDRPDSYDVTAIGGLTIRDYFAGQAIAGMLASDAHPDVDLLALMSSPQQIEARALFAYSLADAMLRARKDGGQ